MVHITRADQWLNARQYPILFDEWRAYVESDPEMRMDDYAQPAVAGGAKLRIDVDGVAVWTVYPSHRSGGNVAWFHYDDGRIVVKNPDGEIIAKMKLIADRLHGHVVGDEGEYY